MPVTEEHALRQFEIEALRQITDNLSRLNDKMDKQGDAISGIDKRLVRIESNRIDADVTEMRQMLLRVKDRLATLEEDKHKRDGAFGLVQWSFKNWPGVVGFIALVIIVLQSTGKINL